MKAVKLLLFCLVVVALAVAGCKRHATISDEAERDHPAMKKARELEQAGDFDGARRAYQSLLDQNPTIARAHLDIAFLQDQAGGDYVDAIYHCRRYLALRPDTEKRAMIEAHIRAAELAYVGTVFTNEAAALKWMAKVEQENSGLKIRVSNLDAQNRHLRASLATLKAKYAGSEALASQSLDHAGLPVPAPRSAGKVVRVERGDNLRKISERVYGSDGRWRDIYQANRRQMKGPGDLHIGQKLVIPERDGE